MELQINIHSAIDIITNSSSEIYTFQTDKSREFICNLINSFCEVKKLRFQISPDDLTDPLDDNYEIRNAIDLLKSKGYIVSRESNNSLFKLMIDRDLVYSELIPLREFLTNTFNIDIEYDG